MVFNSKGKIDVNDKRFMVNPEDELTILSDKIIMKYNLDEELIISGQSREVLLNTKMLTLTLWENISDGVKGSLIGLFSFVLGLLMRPLKEWLSRN